MCQQRNHQQSHAASVKQTLRLETDRIPSQALDPIDGDGQVTSAAELPDVEGPNGSPVSSGDTDDGSSCADILQEHWGSYSGSETDEDMYIGDTDASGLGRSPREARSYSSLFNLSASIVADICCRGLDRYCDIRICGLL